MKTITIHPLSFTLGAVAIGGLLTLTGWQKVSAQRIPLLSAEEREVLSHMSIVYLPDGSGGRTKTIEISGVNLRLVNGLGATNGNPTAPHWIDPQLTQTNGLGNLIVGYNELGNPNGDDRTGSHNLVVGLRNGYSSFGGLVASSENIVSAPYASITGGFRSRVLNAFSTVTGGYDNDAYGGYSTVSGGRANEASLEFRSSRWMKGGGLSRWAFGPRSPPQTQTQTRTRTHTHTHTHTL